MLACVLFGVTLASLHLSGLWLASNTEAFSYASVGYQPPSLPPGTWYLEQGAQVNAFSQELFYYGAGESIDHAREADILFLGSSRMQFGVSWTLLQPWCESRGLSCYQMGFGHGEPMPLPKAVMERHDLRPALVVANVDRFFAPRPSDYGARIMDASLPVGLAQRLAVSTPSLFNLELMPHFIPPAPEGSDLVWGRQSSSQVFRSVEHGGWFAPEIPSKAFPVASPDPADAPTDREIQLCRDFADWLEGRGGELVLIGVHTSTRNLGPMLPALAEAAQVTAVPVDAAGLETFDESHLTPGSAERYTRELLEGLEKTQAFQAVLARGTQPRAAPGTPHAGVPAPMRDLSAPGSGP